MHIQGGSAVNAGPFRVRRETFVEDLRQIHPEALAELTPAQFAQLDRDGYLDMQFSGTMERAQDGIGTVMGKAAMALAAVLGYGGYSGSLAALEVDPKFKELLFDPNSQWGAGQMQRLLDPTLTALPGSSPENRPELQLDAPQPVPPYQPGVLPPPPEDRSVVPDEGGLPNLTTNTPSGNDYLTFIGAETEDRVVSANLAEMHGYVEDGHPQNLYAQSRRDDLQHVELDMGLVSTDTRNRGSSSRFRYNRFIGHDKQGHPTLNTSAIRGARNFYKWAGDGVHRQDGRTNRYTLGEPRNHPNPGDANYDSNIAKPIAQDPRNEPLETYYLEQRLPSYMAENPGKTPEEARTAIQAEISGGATLFDLYQHQSATKINDIPGMNNTQRGEMFTAYETMYEHYREGHPGTPELPANWEDNLTLGDLEAMDYMVSDIGSIQFPGDSEPLGDIQPDFTTNPGRITLSDADQRRVANHSVFMNLNWVVEEQPIIMDNQRATISNAELPEDSPHQITPDRMGHVETGKGVDNVDELATYIEDNAHSNSRVDDPDHVLDAKGTRTTQVVFQGQGQTVTNSEAFGTGLSTLENNVGLISTPETAQYVNTDTEQQAFERAFGITANDPATTPPYGPLPTEGTPPQQRPTPGSKFETMYNAVDTLPTAEDGSVTVNGQRFESRDALKTHILAKNQQAIDGLNATPGRIEERGVQMLEHSRQLTQYAGATHTDVNQTITDLEGSFRDFGTYFQGVVSQADGGRIAPERLTAMRSFVDESALSMAQTFNSLLPPDQRIPIDAATLRENPASLGPTLYTLLDRAKTAQLPDGTPYFNPEQIRRMEDMIDLLQTAKAQVGASNEAAVINNVGQQADALSIRADQAIDLLQGKINDLSEEMETGEARSDRGVNEGTIDRMQAGFQRDMQTLASNPEAFTAFMQSTYQSEDGSPLLNESQIGQIRQRALQGNFPIPAHIAFGQPQKADGTAVNASYSSENGGTITLNQEQLGVTWQNSDGTTGSRQLTAEDFGNYPSLSHISDPNEKAQVLAQVDHMLRLFTEESLHHIDTVTGQTDSHGDEGGLGSDLLYGRDATQGILTRDPQGGVSLNQGTNITQNAQTLRTQHHSSEDREGDVEFNDDNVVPPSGTQPVPDAQPEVPDVPANSGTQPVAEPQPYTISQNFIKLSPEDSTRLQFVDKYGIEPQAYADIADQYIITSSEGGSASRINNIAGFREELVNAGASPSLIGMLDAYHVSQDITHLSVEDREAMRLDAARIAEGGITDQELGDFIDRWKTQVPGLAERNPGIHPDTLQGILTHSSGSRDDFDAAWQDLGSRSLSQLHNASQSAQEADDSGKLSKFLYEGGRAVSQGMAAIGKMAEELMFIWLNQYRNQVQNSKFSTGSEQMIADSHPKSAEDMRAGRAIENKANNSIREMLERDFGETTRERLERERGRHHTTPTEGDPATAPLITETEVERHP